MLKDLWELQHLPIGWDGKYGMPFSYGTLSKACDICSYIDSKSFIEPVIKPSTIGSIRFEWLLDTKSMCIDIFESDKYIVICSYINLEKLLVDRQICRTKSFVFNLISEFIAL